MKRILGLDFSHFRGDLFGGLTAGIVALLQPIAAIYGGSGLLIACRVITGLCLVRSYDV